MELIHIEGSDDISSFYLGKYVVTQQDWLEVAGTPPCKFKGPKFPVRGVNFYQAISFCNVLSLEEGLKPCYKFADGKVIKSIITNSNKDLIIDESANGYRLPTEKEWRYALGGGKDRTFKYCDMDVNDIAWYAENSNSKLQPVGKKLPNELGLYDMLGNVWEYTNEKEGVIRSSVWCGISYKTDTSKYYLHSVRFYKKLHIKISFDLSTNGFRIAKNA